METLVAKRPRVEPQSRNAEEIIQEQRQVIENQKARIQKLEEQLKASESRNQQLEEQLKNSTSLAMEVPVPELPNEIWLEIMSYLSTYEVLRNVAQVSQSFHKLSQDPHVIRKIEVESLESWPKDKEEKYCNDFLEVLKRSLKLKFLSFGFGNDIDDKLGQMLLEALPSLNHPFLYEVCLKGDANIDYYTLSRRYDATEFLNSLNENLFKYLENCPNLKVLKFEFKPYLAEVEEEEEEDEGEYCHDLYPFLEDISEGIRMFKLKNLKELHLIGVDTDRYADRQHNFHGGGKKFLETITENLPKLQRLCLTLKRWEQGWNDIFQKFASEKSIEIEISSVSTCVCGHALDCTPKTHWKCKYFYPK